MISDLLKENIIFIVFEHKKQLFESVTNKEIELKLGEIKNEKN
jgi:hypothetical protein